VVVLASEVWRARCSLASTPISREPNSPLVDIVVVPDLRFRCAQP
jgi:hypothetical protein